MSTSSRRKSAVVVVILLVAVVLGFLFIIRSGTPKHRLSDTAVPPSPTSSADTLAPSASSSSSSTTVPRSLSAFTYGFDLTTEAPDASGTDPTADTSAEKVSSQFSGSTMDLSIYGFGLADPEPSPGDFDMSGISERLSLVSAAGGIPVVSLVGAPAWMRGSPATNSNDTFFQPPSPAHYQDFADLCAHIAETFPTVKYFVVWNELKGFFVKNMWDYQDYTTMYNYVYLAIKHVRPDALVGGPYAPLSSYSSPKDGVTSTVHGSWGYLDQGLLDAIQYWVKEKAGADFIAVDGSTDIAKNNNPDLTDPATASEKYADVDRWIESITNLPIWWMESHIQPTTGWTDQQAVAARVATLGLMAGTGAAVGMQWQPQDDPSWPDEGLWTSTLQPGGGQPTTLATTLLRVLPILKRSFSLAGGEPPGVVVGTSPAGTLIVNTLNSDAQAAVDGTTIPLGPGAVVVK